jgi:hypothetical protein
MGFIPRRSSLLSILEKLSDDTVVKLKDSIKRTGATKVVLFENLDFSSSNFGLRTVLCVGPSCTYKTVEELHDHHLGDVPSRFQWPTMWATVDVQPTDEDIEEAQMRRR